MCPLCLLWETNACIPRMFSVAAEPVACELPSASFACRRHRTTRAAHGPRAHERPVQRLGHSVGARLSSVRARTSMHAHASAVTTTCLRWVADHIARLDALQATPAESTHHGSDDPKQPPPETHEPQEATEDTGGITIRQIIAANFDNLSVADFLETVVQSRLLCCCA